MPIKNLKSSMKSEGQTNSALSKLVPSKSGVFKSVLVLLFIAAIGSSGYFYYQYKQVKNAADIVDAKKTITAVAKLMNVPEKEVPTIATVTDKTKLKSQPFFKAAENGDKVLIYASIKKAILYRPSTNKIIDVTPVNTESLSKNGQNNPGTTANSNTKVLGAEESKDDANKKLTGTPSPTEEQKEYSVAILNASSTQGAASTIETKIKGVEGVTVGAKDNAQKQYDTSTVVVLNQSANDLGKKLAGVLNYEIATNMPSGETAPSDSDVVVIIGANGI